VEQVNITCTVLADSDTSCCSVSSKIMDPHCPLQHWCILAILKQSRPHPQRLIHSNNEIYCACRHRPCFHVHVKQTTPSTNESKSQPDTRNTRSCHRFCWVQCLPSWCLTGSTMRTNKKKLFSICFQSTSLRNNFNNLLWISHPLLFDMILLVAPDMLDGFCRMHQLIY